MLLIKSLKNHSLRVWELISKKHLFCSLKMLFIRKTIEWSWQNTCLKNIKFPRFFWLKILSWLHFLAEDHQHSFLIADISHQLLHQLMMVMLFSNVLLNMILVENNWPEIYTTLSSIKSKCLSSQGTPFQKDLLMLTEQKCCNWMIWARVNHWRTLIQIIIYGVN